MSKKQFTGFSINTEAMIKSISSIKNISYKALKRVQSFVLTNNIFSPKLAKPLDKDVFELSAKKKQPEVLTFNPQIIIGKFESGIKDSRFKYFNTEYRAYDYEGYDNIFPAEYICIDSKGERRLKPHIYLNLVEVKPEFAKKGLYSKAIKQLETIALAEEGCDGRIILDARRIEGPYVAKIPSPSLAHWKCGFRFAEDNNNKIMEKVLKGELPPEEAPEGTMYYAFI